MNDKIHKALGIFLDAMRPFVVGFLQQHFPNEPWERLYFSRLKAPKRATWNQALKAQGENQSCISLIDYNNLTDFAPGFKQELGIEFGLPDKANKFISYLQELKDIRNKCNHYQVLDNEEIDGAYLYIKQAAKLMKMDELVSEIDNIKNQEQPMAQPVQAMAPPMQTAAVTMREDAPIPAWFTNVYPHYDIRNGVLDESIFAANLGEVALGIGQEVYNNPTIFFEKPISLPDFETLPTGWFVH